MSNLSQSRVRNPESHTRDITLTLFRIAPRRVPCLQYLRFSLSLIMAPNQATQSQQGITKTLSGANAAFNDKVGCFKLFSSSAI